MPNFNNQTAVEVRAWMSNYIPLFDVAVITCPCRDLPTIYETDGGDNEERNVGDVFLGFVGVNRHQVGDLTNVQGSSGHAQGLWTMQT